MSVGNANPNMEFDLVRVAYSDVSVEVLNHSEPMFQ